MTPKEIADLLAEPFPADAISWKPQAISKDGKKGLAIAFINARNVIDRLNQVVGLDCWEDHYRESPHGVTCTLRVNVADRWVEHEDFGSLSDQPDQGDKHKAAYSDALKRSAVKFGVGRYLYDLDSQWLPVDQYKKFTQTPTLPAWALPKKPEQPNGVHASPMGGTIALWKARLDKDPTLSAINGMIGELKLMDPPTKLAVWELVKGWAERAGLLWDREKKEFFVPDDAKEGAA